MNLNRKKRKMDSFLEELKKCVLRIELYIQRNCLSRDQADRETRLAYKAGSKLLPTLTSIFKAPAF